MRHLDELSMRLGFRVYLNCRGKEPTPEQVLDDPKARQYVQDIINHYKEMNHVTEAESVSERKESELPATAERVSVQRNH